jgi:hypothetical protein
VAIRLDEYVTNESAIKLSAGESFVQEVIKPLGLLAKFFKRRRAIVSLQLLVRLGGEKVFVVVQY